MIPSRIQSGIDRIAAVIIDGFLDGQVGRESISSRYRDKIFEYAYITGYYLGQKSPPRCALCEKKPGRKATA